ncbi:hypothetical protein [Actinomadura violacea]|uniref:TrbL/VirB6 plasmid conjugal transfer protein n=1 Tax=Actinomadura violacea TaxID=2819934 RepID=A0ABS3S7G7_9ACTN|nr:hypothetical protein [Actinomadura violacea]MBO2464939.1 hypothetical protein [Actinomadura violacea]
MNAPLLGRVRRAGVLVAALTMAVLVAVLAVPGIAGQAAADPAPTPSSSPSATATPGGGQNGKNDKKNCWGKIPNLPVPIPNIPNLPDCSRQAIHEGAQQVAGAASDAVLTPLANAIAKTTNQLVLVTVTGWLQLPSIRLTKSGIYVQPDQSHAGKKLANGGCIKPLPNATLSPQAPGADPPASGDGSGGGATGDACSIDSPAVTQFASAKVQAVMISVGTLVAVLLLIFQGMRTAFSRRGTHLMDALQGLMVMAVMAAIGIVILDGLLVFSDVLTKEILQGSMGDGLNKRVTAMLGLSVTTLGPGPVILFGLFVFTVGLVQLVMLFIRQAAIPVLAMLMPVAAAGQVGGQISRQWLIRLWTSLFAIVLYKPLAALIFAVGFLEVNQGQGFWEIVRGLTTLVLAIMALPTLMKIFQPIVGAAVSIGEHNVTLAGFIGGMGEAGGIMSNLTGRGGGASGGNGQDGDAAPANPQSYLGGGLGGRGGAEAGAGAAGGGAAAAVPAAGAALAVAETGEKVGDRVDQAVAKGADAFVGGDGQPAPPTAGTGLGGSSTSGDDRGAGPGGDHRDDPRDDPRDVGLDPGRQPTDQWQHERHDREGDGR